ncbi:hypothetical protein H6G89_32045 [Oscillatoria sp. FACHB-1407]|uniref:hypothetical protein n=1 Tax=Oscillatoria sp. FACHB-1407 TaxID=2692847 RepID=UPI0016873EB5|nr:hypothetical protein [Oscillatoria sp. FACHB-1407]MBD2465626.1 hypothetical protein [Oscillatoria sp. FACHB-1407]
MRSVFQSRVFRKCLCATWITGALMLGSSPIAPHNAIALPSNNTATETHLKQAQVGPRLPGSVSSRVRRALSRFLNVRRRDISIVSYTQQVWADSCLGLGTPLDQCRQETIQGWRVVVTNGQRNWTYRSDRSGRRLRLEEQGNNMTNVNLPDEVFSAVVQDAQRRSRLSVSTIRLLWAQERNWSDSCLGLSNPEVICTAVLTPGWLIGVEVEQQVWIYRTDFAGTVVRPEAQTTDVGLPGIVSQLVMQDVRTRTTDSVRIIQYEPREWSDGCLGLPEAGEFCTQAIVPGWRVVIESETGQRWAYRTDSNGGTLRLERPRQPTPIPQIPR